jgi:hypothetical protein
MTLLSLALALLPGTSLPRDEGYTYPPRRHGDVVLTLNVRVAAQSIAPGLARATVTLQVQGMAGLAVQPLRLEDATAAWKAEQRSSGWAPRARDARTAGWTETLSLAQVKPGLVALPGLRVRFRPAPDSPWREERWTDLLKELRDAPQPEQLPPPPPSPWPRRLALAGLALVAALLLLAVTWGVRRWRAVPVPPLPPHRRALAELERLEASATQPDSSGFHDRLAGVLRAYLAARFELATGRQTSAEILTAVAALPDIPPPALDSLREVLQRCDLARFARASLSPEDCRATLAAARAFVEQTAPAEAPRT